MNLVAVSFFAQYTFGQWVVISIIGMLFLGVLTLLMWGTEDGDWTGFAFLWGMIVYWIMFLILTIIVWFISLIQWLWVL